MAPTLAPSAHESLIHHVFLPPQLPQSDDSACHVDLHEALMSTTLATLDALMAQVLPNQRGSIRRMSRMVANMRSVHTTTGIVSEDMLLRFLTKLSDQDLATTIPLHLGAQNAGVLITRVEDSIHFEVFELAPLNEAVYSTKGRLRRSFPGSAIAIDLAVFQEDGFQTTVAHTLAEMSRHAVAGMQPQVRKAREDVDEDRDTTNPAMVTEFFMAFLAAVGQSVDTSVILKNTREEVLWRNARSPWRRSPTWLLLRVALHLNLSRLQESTLYKELMVMLMSRLLKQPSEPPISNELFSFMSAKISRRLLKLGSSINQGVLSIVQKILRDRIAGLEEQWSLLQRTNHPDITALYALDFEQDSFVTLPALDEYLKSIHARRASERSNNFQPASGLIMLEPQILPQLTGICSNPDYTPHNLHAFELWVASEIAEWSVTHKSDPSTCQQLGSLIKSYHTIASYRYRGNPEALSIMHLTVLQLWMACDASAVCLCPLLGDYNPGLSLDFAQNLLLPSKSQMNRLHDVEEYVASRKTVAHLGSRKLFHDVVGLDCFGSKYVDQSPKHQSLLDNIKTRAEQDKRAKIEELGQKKEEYEALMKLHRAGKCQYEEVYVDFANDIKKEQHSSSCEKCRYSQRAENLRISVHEWPLPTVVAKQKFVVFELHPPPFFACWRDSMFFLILNVLKADPATEIRGRAYYPLSRDFQLSCPHFTGIPSQRMSLRSQDKPHSCSHRKEHVVSTATEADVCLASGLNYAYYDWDICLFVGKELFKSTDKTPLECTYELPPQSVALQKYLFRTAANPNGMTPNMTIAGLSECSYHMSLDEYKKLSSIPLGCNLQWPNVLLQLGFPAIDFKKIESTLVILQCIYQAGPPSSNTFRAGHAFGGDHNSATKLLEELGIALQRIKESWDSSQALSIFISIASRLLSLSPSTDIQDSCIIYLEDARKVALGWVHNLREKAQLVESQDERREYLSKRAEIALICIDSFNVDDTHLDKILTASTEQASILIQCSIIVQESMQILSGSSESTIQILLLRSQKVLYSCHRRLAMNSPALDDGIGQTWTGFHPGAPWTTAAFDHWLTTTTKVEGAGSTLRVHFNILNGELLVNGQPLDRLPRQYETHSSYPTLFGSSAIKVTPSGIEGMALEAVQEFFGYRIRFGMNVRAGNATNDLLIQAERDGRKFELIPVDLFRTSFPAAFIDEYVHWYDRDNGTLEFRPVKEPWDATSPRTWILARNQGTSKWRLTQDNSARLLLGLTSVSLKVLSRILSPLADPTRIHVVFQTLLREVDVELPGLQLGFTLRSKGFTLQCREFPKMSVDSGQSLTTLVGLQNMLLLKDDRGNRQVLIIDGMVSYKRNHDKSHVSVAIEKSTSCKFHTFHVDDRLGRLIDNGSLQSKLFLAQLHALTSFCLPDPLTCKTGTEQALSILSSAAVRSFDRLTEDNINILSKIATLTPARRFYPANEQVMQTVDWSSELGFLAQHAGFRAAVEAIFDQARRSSIFYPELTLVLPDLVRSDPGLMQRESIRSAIFRVSGFGAEDFTTAYDAAYDSRHQGQTSLKFSSNVKFSKAFIMSSFIYHQKQDLNWMVPANVADHLWKAIASTPSILGSGVLSHYTLEYDATLLEKSLQTAVFPFWIALNQGLSAVTNKFSIMMWLSTVACMTMNSLDTNVLQILALSSTRNDVKVALPPPCHSFCLQLGKAVSQGELRSIVTALLVGLRGSPDFAMVQHHNETPYSFGVRRNQVYQATTNRIVTLIVDGLAAQWPCQVPHAPDLSSVSNASAYIDISRVMNEVRPKFKSWFDNLDFFKYLQRIGDVVSELPITVIDVVPRLELPSPSAIRSTATIQSISENDLFAADGPQIPFNHIAIMSLQWLSCREDLSSRKNARLNRLISILQVSAAQSKYEKEYVADLQDSVLELQKSKGSYSLRLDNDTQHDLALHLRVCKERVESVYSIILSAVAPGSTTSPNPKLDQAATLWMVKHWPRVSPTFFLQQLSRLRWPFLNQRWKDAIVQYGLALTALQRAERLVNAYQSRSEVDMINELCNIGGHVQCEANQCVYPDSLLLEVESGILIRENQEKIAGTMRDPKPTTNARNAVMQLNMGEGKSSTIVPIVAAALANGTQLVRVVVAKPQSKQMAQMMISKLGGLLNRRVYYMPFSRALRPTKVAADIIGSLLRECMSSGGILLVQPEHILSFKLMGLESLILGKGEIGRSLLSTQDFFDKSSRDLLDESDEILSVKFELVYTIGTQRPVDMSPDRWLCIHEVLRLIRKFSPATAKKIPGSLELAHCHAGRFPRTRLLKRDAQDHLFNAIALHICNTGLPSFPVARQSQEVRDTVFKYITKLDLSVDEIADVEGPGGFWTDTTKHTLLLLRGLLAGGVLSFVFGQKRWRVNYGLDSTRNPSTKLAVPYRAKDNPSPSSEFSHPDVVIVMTTLSYYYGGLGEDDLATAFDHLVRSDQADTAYQAWAKDADDMPTAFTQLEGINLRDKHQFKSELLPRLKYGKATIDYFLANIVFPKEMKEFPHKLSASGWDIGKNKILPMTGFSGTNDSRTALPLYVEHKDLSEQKHTNALVLGYLLQDGNDVRSIPAPTTAQSLTSDAERLLDMVVKLDPPARVILDVGAQIIELSNIGVARRWLALSSPSLSHAVIFFDEHDELSVINRKGRVELLQTSSYAVKIEVCLVFLDESHTRGTDLRLPENYRAAVTLGAGLTKDRLTQACMRMRKLGKGQTVVFFVPQEISQKIRECTSKPLDTRIDVLDILQWTISETWRDMARSIPLWAVQGDRFVRHNELWEQAQDKGHTTLSAEAFLENDAQSLEARYRPSTNPGISLFTSDHEDCNRIKQRCIDLKILYFNSATLQEEQERELSPEVEQEVQIQKPAPAKPCPHSIHPDLVHFVIAGVLPARSQACQPAFAALCHTSAAQFIDLMQLSDDSERDLLVSLDFARTIDISANGPPSYTDSYQRPVQWILTAISNSTVTRMIVISPYEAQELHSRVMTSSKVALHLYSPRCNEGFRSLDRLGFLIVPHQPTPAVDRRFVVQLILFSGQLYINDYDDFKYMCEYLGLATETAEEGWEIAADGFILKDGNGKAGGNGSKLTKSPVKFLQTLMTIRRDGEGISKTHMGALLEGRLLQAADFEE